MNTKKDWLDIASAPKDGTPVLLFCPKVGVIRGSWDTNQYASKPRPYWSTDMERILGVTTTRGDQPTHWMPLPAAPGSPASTVATEGEKTPGATWREKGDADPHGDRYACERAALAMGNLTDDELANGAFMNYDRPLDIDALMQRRPGYHPPIAWMTAVKDRIRWLSRKLEEAQVAPAAGDALDLTLAQKYEDACIAANANARDAERYRWLRDPQTDVALVLDKRTGYVPEDESVPGVGGYHTYEYRAGEELDAAIDAAIAQQSQRKEA